MHEQCRARGAAKDMEVLSTNAVRVETCGKSARIGVEASVAVNSIRSNTVEETRLARLFPMRWLESTGNDAPR